MAALFVLTQPGIPLLFQGDEFGQPGSGDPDNRRFMRFGGDLSAREQALLAKVQAVGKARATHAGLRRGGQRTLRAQGDLYVYARGAGTRQGRNERCACGSGRKYKHCCSR